MNCVCISKSVAWNRRLILGKLLKCSFIEVPITLRNNPQKKIVSDLITRKPGPLTYFFIASVF